MAMVALTGDAWVKTVEHLASENVGSDPRVSRGAADRVKRVRLKDLATLDGVAVPRRRS
jgi:hypothetical protein